MRGESRSGSATPATEAINVRPRCEKRHPSRVASQGFFAGHWPPSELDCGGYLRRSFYGLPGWLFPFKGRSSAVARAGYPVWLWLAGPTCSGRIITGAYYIAIDMPIVTKLILKGLLDFLYTIFTDSGSFSAGFLPKTVILLVLELLGLNADSWDNSGFRALPARCAGSASGSGGRAGRCAGRRSAPVERSPVLRRRPRNPRPTTRPGGWRR